MLLLGQDLHYVVLALKKKISRVSVSEVVQVKMMLKEQSVVWGPKQEKVGGMPGRRKTGKCLSVGECCLKLMLNCKGSAVDSIVSRCVQTFSSGIVVNTKMFTEKRYKSSNLFFLSESYQSNSCLFKLGSSFFFLNTGLVNMILEEIPEPWWS